MDILPTETISVVTTAFKLLFFISGIMILAINYFQSKEANKMERKLSVGIPGSIQIALSVQIFASILFLLASFVVLFFF